MELATTAWTKAYRRQDASPIAGANTDLTSMCEACSSPGPIRVGRPAFRRSLVGVASKGALTPREVAEDPVISALFMDDVLEFVLVSRFEGTLAAGMAGLVCKCGGVYGVLLV